MLIIALHGFGMTGDGDDFCQEVKALAEEHGHVGLTPTYPSNNPHLAHIYLTGYTKSKMEYHNSDAIFVGHSLGGFWARHLARTFGASYLVLANPSLHPWQSLQPYVGANRNFCNNEQFELAPNDAAAYYIYRGDDGENAISRVRTLLIATENSDQGIIDLFSNKRNVEVDVVSGYDDILPSIEDTLFPKEEDSVE